MENKEILRRHSKITILFHNTVVHPTKTEPSTMKIRLLQINKAGHTATSCGRVGRGGNARFHTFQLDHYRRMDQRTAERMDKAPYRVACPQLKNDKSAFDVSTI